MTPEIAQKMEALEEKYGISEADLMSDAIETIEKTYKLRKELLVRPVGRVDKKGYLDIER